MRQMLIDNAILIFPTFLGYILYSMLGKEVVKVDLLVSSTRGAF